MFNNFKTYYIFEILPRNTKKNVHENTFLAFKFGFLYE